MFFFKVKRRVPKRVGKSGSLSQRPLVTCHVWRGIISIASLNQSPKFKNIQYTLSKKACKRNWGYFG
jgi:hypothetical protein